MNKEITIQDLANAILKLSQAFTVYVAKTEKRITDLEYAIDFLHKKLQEGK